MLKFLSTKNWSRYSRQNSEDTEALYQYRRIILLSQFTLFGFVASVIHSLEDLVDGLYFMPAMDFTMGIVVFSCYLLNENGKHRIAKVLLLTFLNVFFFVYSISVPKELGIYLYYFPWVALAALVFEVNENKYRFFFIALSVALLVTLFATDFDISGMVKFQAVAIERSFIINMVSSLAVLAFFIVFMSNMNEQSENRLYEMAGEVKAKNTDLEKANRELDRFFYSTSHDLKIPVMDIKGIVNKAIAEMKDPEVLEHFILLRDRTQKLDEFLKDIIDYARNTKTGVRLTPVHLEGLVDQVLENFRFITGADKIRFEKGMERNLTVETDRVRLFIILNNVISNAVVYHRQNIRDRWVRISADYSEGKLRLIISDNGQGIDPELIPKVFNMFFRGTAQSKGSGLGLYIVKEAIEKLNGDIGIESVPNKGTTLTITLPAKQTDAPESTYQKQNSDPVVSKHGG